MIVAEKVAWVSVNAFLEEDHWSSFVTVAFGEPTEKDPRDVVWRERGRTAWEALAKAVMRVEQEGRASTPDEPVEMEFWKDEPPIKLLWARFPSAVSG